MTTTKTRVWAIVALVIMATGFSACLKNNNVTPQRDRAAVAVINGILTSSNLDFYDNDTKINNGPIQHGFLSIQYLIYGGVHTFSYKLAGQTATYAAVTNLYDSLTYNTIVSYGDSTAPQVRTIEDDFTGAKEEAINIRFFHLSPTIPPVDLYIDNVKVDSNRAYVGTNGFSTAFKPITKGLFSSNLKVKLAGTDSVLAENTSPQATIAVGRVYTIMLMGAKEFTDKKKLTVNSIYSYY